MLTAFSIFRLSNVLYQVIATFLVYGLQLCSVSYPALLREGLWCLLLLITTIYGYKSIKTYRKCWKQAIITFIVLIIISIGFSLLINHTSFSNIFIGIKYGFWWAFILLSATFFGFVFSEKLKKSKILNVLPRVLVIIVVLGFLLQGAKLIRPNFFYSLGYGGLDDYSFGDKPPIYYLTGYQGTLRWQGFFSGPNNYGYFLVAFLPFIRWFFTNKINKKQNTALSVIALVIRMCGMLATLSRAVLVGIVVVFVLMYWNKLKTKKRLLIWGGLGIFITLMLLSVLKRESTIGHIKSKFDTIPEVISAPLGHGLGSSGPAVHYEGKFLPENYYLQIMLDIGTVGFLFWAISILYLLWTQYRIVNSYKGDINEQEQFYLIAFRRMQMGLLALFVMGLFLHVFEDSMVNYLFFTIYGIVLGCLSKNLKKEIGRNIKIQK